MTHVAITGSTGRVGGAVAQILSDAAIPTRLLVRDPDRAPALPHTEIARADYAHVPRSVAALRGIDTVFMLPLHDGADHLVDHHDFVDAIVQAGVQQVVYLSHVGAAQQAISFVGRQHGDTESYLAATDLEHTVIRTNFFAETLQGFLGEDGFCMPAADGRIAAVARNDVAAAIAAVLMDPHPHRGKAYELSGPRAMNFHDIATVFTDLYGEPVPVVDQSEDEALKHLASRLVPPSVVEEWMSVWRAIRQGVHGQVTEDVRLLTGREPASVVEALSRLPD